MTDNLLNEEKISIQRNKNLFSKLQAGILKGHGRDHVHFLLLHFNQFDINNVKHILSNLKITSALEQYEQTQRRIGNETVLTCYISFKGYKALGLTPNSTSQAFENGMASRKNLLGDSPENWEDHYRPNKTEIHAIVSIANDDPNEIKNEEASLKETFGNSIKIIETEVGKVKKNNDNQPIEHFGYVDGISQPLFLEQDFYDKMGIPKKINHWDPKAPLSLVLTKDPMLEGDTLLGSYMVFRKLEQNVKAFKEAETQLAKDLGLTESSEEAAGAFIIGRF